MQDVCRGGERRWRRRAVSIDTLIMGHLQHTDSVHSSRRATETHQHHEHTCDRTPVSTALMLL